MKLFAQTTFNQYIYTMSAALLNPNRLAVIRTNAEEFKRVFAAAPQMLSNPGPSTERQELLDHIDAQAAALSAATARAEAAEARLAEVLDEWQDDALQRDSSPRMEADTRRWFVLKAAELGVKWPHCSAASASPVAGSGGEGRWLETEEQPNPHKDPAFGGCWGNASCPCDSKCPEDCPLCLPPDELD